jgi:hypothetical protein
MKFRYSAISARSGRETCVAALQRRETRETVMARTWLD